MFVAYFLGGPFDLTKKILEEPLPVFRMAEFLDPYIELHADIPVGTPLQVSEYVRVASIRDTPDGRVILIYYYEGGSHVKCDKY